MNVKRVKINRAYRAIKLGVDYEGNKKDIL